MEWKIFAPFGAAIFVAIVIASTVIELTSTDKESEGQIHPGLNHRSDADAIGEALRHCRDMGEVATRDPVCLKLWADNRNRFLGQPASDTPAASIPTAEASGVR